ncbi:MAG TPA: type IIL restriction-modification enzyme MmeI [Allosphingosinicella sp.]|jgi:type I restriction-modification system DNA methylase subunit
MTVDEFIERWRNNEGGAERANYALFLTELCTLLDLPQPDPANATHENNDYVFERAVQFRDEAGKTGHGRMDLYKRGCFVLEAKQSRQRGGSKEVAMAPEQAALPGIEGHGNRGRRSAHRGWDVLMRNAREQAEQYARALPTAHGWPPFIIVCDVGHAFEIFADFSGQGKNYRLFPDRSGFRIYLDDLRDEAVRDRLRAIWLDPHSLDPTKRAAAVTRDIAKRLAKVSQSLEERGYGAEKVAHFLMRCLFTMFAEDTALLEPGSFAEVLGDARSNPDSFAPMMEELWRAMDQGGFSGVLRRNVRKFNGGLFSDRTAIPLLKEEIGELYEAAKHVWTEVEPAIFGTLLEQALDKAERKRLGAHYTPRAYVERLVIATIIEPLRQEWEGEVLGTVERERAADPQAAIRAVHDFHVKLASTKVLDPACGTGNFLYVALELMKQLEGEVLEVLADLGGQEALAMETMSVHPKNFLGMELNPRAAAIAELVLWLGYLQWQLRNGGVIADPVLERLDNVKSMDAVLKHEGESRKADGTGTELPNPRRPEWPEADYIVGNPPFIGKGAAMRDALGAAYVEALWKAHPHINKSADFVMYWWDRAADQLTRRGTRLKRFGLVTTNSITQDFSRRVIQTRLDGRPSTTLVMAIPDHPWTKANADAAAVRIAMTVAQLGVGNGTLHEVARESALDTDQPNVELTSVFGTINSDLTVGTDANDVRDLTSNDGLACNGMMLAGRGFVLSQREANHLISISHPGADTIIKPYMGGSDLVRKSSDRWVIDAFGWSEETLRRDFPQIYQHLLVTVKPVRQENRRDKFREKWWIFGEPRRTFRPALRGLRRYVGTTETSKHRIFQFIDQAVTPDHMIVCFAFETGFELGILSSRFHLCWTVRVGGWLGVGNDSRYSKSNVFDPFPFPDATHEQRTTIAAIAEEIDDSRKKVLADYSDLTLTTLYNLREKLLKGEIFTTKEEDQRMRGRVDIIAELHDRLDAAVAEAYGWPADLSDEEIVARLVALNAERAAEERRGIVRWLRPEYQQKKAGVAAIEKKPEAEQIEALLPEAKAGKPSFPRDAIGQTAAVLADLRGGAALTADDIAMRYKQGRKVSPRIQSTLEALVRLGYVASADGRYRLRRAA